MGLGALGAVAGGINRGWDMAQRDQEIERQRALQDENQAFMRQQREVWSQAQQRENDLANDMQAATAPTKKVKQRVPDLASETVDANGDLPMTEQEVDVPRSQIDIARSQGNALQKARKYTEAQQLFTWANQESQKNAAQNLYTNLRSLPKDASLEQIARAAAPAIDADESPVGIDTKNISVDPQTGAVTVPMFNKLTGYKTTQTFADKNQLKEALQWHFDPETMKSRQSKAYELELKAQEKLIENPVSSVPGGYYDKKTGKFVPTMVAGDIIGYNADGSPIYGKGPGGSGSGAGAGTGKGGKVEAPNSAYMGALDDAIKTSEIKFATPDEAIKVRTIADTFANGAGYNTSKLPPNVAAQAALNYVRAGGAKAEKVGVDPETGMARREYADPEYGTFSLGPAKLTPEQLKQTAPVMLSQQGFDGSGKPIQRLVKGEDGSIQSAQTTKEDAAAYQKKLRAAAFDKSGPNGTSVLRRDLETDIKNQVQLSAEQAIAQYPDRAEQIKAAIPQRVEQQLGILNRKLNLISSAMKPEEQAEKPAAAPRLSERLKSVSAGLPKGIAAAANKVAADQDAKAASDAATREQESAAARAKADESKQLKAEALAIPVDAIRQSNDLNELTTVLKKYDRFMDGRQREALYQRIDFLRRQQLNRR